MNKLVLATIPFEPGGLGHGGCHDGGQRGWGCEVDPSNSIANLLQMLLTEITIYD